MTTARPCEPSTRIAHPAGRALAARLQPRAGRPTRAAAPRVAFVMKTLNHPFFLDMQRGAQEAADRAGVDLVVQAAEREIDVEKQMQIIENLIQTGIKALIVTPSGSTEIAPAIAKANRANIPVIVVDTRVDPKAAADNEPEARVVHRLGQLRRRADRRRVSGEGDRRQGARSPSSRAFPATRPATRGCAGSATRWRAHPA